jgi:hypothetical protein
VISIIDPEELKNVLRPTVYAADIDALPSATGRLSVAGAKGDDDDTLPRQTESGNPQSARTRGG